MIDVGKFRGALDGVASSAIPRRVALAWLDVAEPRLSDAIAKSYVLALPGQTTRQNLALRLGASRVVATGLADGSFFPDGERLKQDIVQVAIEENAVWEGAGAKADHLMRLQTEFRDRLVVASFAVGSIVLAVVAVGVALFLYWELAR